MNNKDANAYCYIMGTFSAVLLLVDRLAQPMSIQIDVLYSVIVVMYVISMMRTLTDNRMLVRYGLTVSLFGGLILPLFVILHEMLNHNDKNVFVIRLESEKPEYQWINGDLYLNVLPKVGEAIEFVGFYVYVMSISHMANGRTVLHIGEPKEY